jgi:hypothetical protein
MYHEGECQMQTVGLAEYGGKEFTANHLEWGLHLLGAVPTTEGDDPRCVKPQPFKMNIARGFVSRGRNADCDDDY